jgi:hypothetical protein
MLLYQDSGYDWAVEAKYLMDQKDKAVAASPRISPPFCEHLNISDAPSVHEVQKLFPVEGGWRNDWFNTRCFLMDRNKFDAYLPPIQGSLLLETLALNHICI